MEIQNQNMRGKVTYQMIDLISYNMIISFLHWGGEWVSAIIASGAIFWGVYTTKRATTPVVEFRFRKRNNEYTKKGLVYLLEAASVGPVNFVPIKSYLVVHHPKGKFKSRYGDYDDLTQYFNPGQISNLVRTPIQPSYISFEIVKHELKDEPCNVDFRIVDIRGKEFSFRFHYDPKDLITMITEV